MTQIVRPISTYQGHLLRQFKGQLKNLAETLEIHWAPAEGCAGIDGPARLLNPDGTAAAYFSEPPDRPHGLVILGQDDQHPNHDTLASSIPQFLPRGLIYETRRIENGNTAFVFYPKLEDSEVETLQTKIEPHRAHLIVMPGEYAILAARDPNARELSAYGFNYPKMPNYCKTFLIYEDAPGSRAALGYSPFFGNDGTGEQTDLWLVQQMCFDLYLQRATRENLVLSYGHSGLDERIARFLQAD